MQGCKNTCPEKYDLGCINHCDQVALELCAPDDGVYVFKYSISGNLIQQKKSYKKGDKFIIDATCLNECADTSLEIFTSDGVKINFTSGDCTYTGFEFQTQIIQYK